MLVCSKRPERAEAPSPGHRPGWFMCARSSPCKGKSVKNTRRITKLLPLQGALLIANYTQGVALGYGLLPFQGERRQVFVGLNPVHEPHAIVLFIFSFVAPSYSGTSSSPDIKRGRRVSRRRERREFSNRKEIILFRIGSNSSFAFFIESLSGIATKASSK